MNHLLKLLYHGPVSDRGILFFLIIQEIQELSRNSDVAVSWLVGLEVGQMPDPSPGSYAHSDKRVSGSGLWLPHWSSGQEYPGE